MSVEGCLGLLRCFARLDALVSRLIKLGVSKSGHVPFRDVAVEWCSTAEHAIHVSHTGYTLNFDRFLLKDEAQQNMSLMSNTLYASYLERSPLNELAPANIALIVIALETSHFEMSPLVISCPCR